MTQEWRLLSERPGVAGYLPIVTRRYQLPDRNEADWDIFGGDRCVAVVAITDSSEVVLARQYRPGPGKVLDELPGRRVEGGEEILAAAARELLEETGYAGDLELAGTSWFASACRTQRFVAVVRGAHLVATPANESGEFYEVVLLSLEDFRMPLR